MGFEYLPSSWWDQPFLEALIDDHSRGLSNIESSVEELFLHVQALLSKIYDCVDWTLVLGTFSNFSAELVPSTE